MKKDNFKFALFFYRKQILIFIFDCILVFLLTLNIISGTFEFEFWEIMIYFSSIVYAYIFLSKFVKVFNNYNLLSAGNNIVNTKNRTIEKIKKSKSFAIILTLFVSFPIDLMLISTIILIWTLSFGIIDINSNGGILFWVFISMLFIFFDYLGIKQMISTYKSLYSFNNKR